MGKTPWNKATIPKSYKLFSGFLIWVEAVKISILTAFPWSGILVHEV